MNRSTVAKMPAYQEYPADILNNETFIRMSMAERGLLWTLRMFCWKNETIPASHQDLAKLLNISVKEIERLYSENVGSFFALSGDNAPSGRMFCLDLEVYRQEALERRAKRAANGRLGGLRKSGAESEFA